jgi:hypothetical protein
MRFIKVIAVNGQFGYSGEKIMRLPEIESVHMFSISNLKVANGK